MTVYITNMNFKSTDEKKGFADPPHVLLINNTEKMIIYSNCVNALFFFLNVSSFYLGRVGGKKTPGPKPLFHKIQHPILFLSFQIKPYKYRANIYISIIAD